MQTKTDLSHVAFLVGPTGKVTTWNEACRQWLGYVASDVLLRPVASMLAPQARQACQQRLQGPRAEVDMFEAEMLHADGSTSLFRLTLVPQFRHAGKFSSYSVILDRPVEGGMTEPEVVGRMPLKEMMDFLAGTFYVINASGRMVMWNKRVEQATGMGPAQLAGVHALDLFPADQKARVAAKISEVFNQDGEVVVEADLLASDGSATPYLFSGSRFGTHGQLFLCGMGLDLTERRKQEEQLRLRERALHASSNGIVITRCAGRDNPIEYVNPAFERITGYAAHEAVGRDARFMAASGVDEDERAKLRAAIGERREVKVLFRNQRKNGEVFWNDLAVTPVLDERGVATHFIGVINDVTASIHRTTYLEHELNHDLLTGLASRNLLWDRLDQALHVAQRNKTLVAVVMVDLDNFKDINDTLGHDGGDEVLKVVARRLQASVRDSDTVARLGGDEFVLILDNQPSLRFTLRMIDRLRQDMAKPVTVGNRELDVQTSMGVSIFPHDAANALEMMQAADVAMYHAKGAGRNDVHFFSAEMKAATEAKHKLEAGIAHALDKGEMVLMLQPMLCLKTGKIVGAEALLRWRHPEQGLLLPAAFLPEAEESGLIIRIGDWVFEHACAMLQQLRGHGFGELVLSLNVSFREFSQRNYAAALGHKLSAARLPPGALELEIKEAYLLRNPKLTREIFTQIKQLGVRLSIDEFGAGVSSLSNLQELSVNHLKISRPFIESIRSAKGDGAMAKAMIAIGHNLNIGVIAEGVETSGQLNFLKQNGCDEIQGNYISEPVCLAAFERLLGELNA